MSDHDRQPERKPTRAEDRDPGWAVPVAFGAVALLIGALVFYNFGGSPTLTAANTTAQTQQAPPALPAPAPKQ